MIDNQIRYFKPSLNKNRVIKGEWLEIKSEGAAPCPRFGHAMVFMPNKHSLCVFGGRNDTIVQKPILCDIYLYLLD
ncbi:MAG: hypothetical protein ACKO96_34665 [Flammeovirgaceae bacterium]